MDHINSNFKKFIFQNYTNLVYTFNYNLKNIKILTSIDFKVIENHVITHFNL